MDNLIAKGAQIIKEAKKILIFSGAGMSTESGIPDFRSPIFTLTRLFPVKRPGKNTGR